MLCGYQGDSYDNALAESIIGLFKTQVIHKRSQWKSIDPVEYATLPLRGSRGPSPVLANVSKRHTIASPSRFQRS